MNQILVLMSGPSGGGKTTLAKQIAKVIDAEVYSTDDFHMENGTYKFKPEKLGQFHQANIERSVAAMKAGKNVIVDNTNIHCYEAKPYIKAAVELGITVKFVRADGNFQGIHGVPSNKVAKMRAEMEELSIEKCLASKAPWE